MRLEFDGPLSVCSSRLAFTGTAICRLVVKHGDLFESREIKNLTFGGGLPYREVRVTAIFCNYQMARCPSLVH